MILSFLHAFMKLIMYAIKHLLVYPLIVIIHLIRPLSHNPQQLMHMQSLIAYNLYVMVIVFIFSCAHCMLQDFM